MTVREVLGILIPPTMLMMAMRVTQNSFQCKLLSTTLGKQEPSKLWWVWFHQCCNIVVRHSNYMSTKSYQLKFDWKSYLPCILVSLYGQFGINVLIVSRVRCSSVYRPHKNVWLVHTQASETMYCNTHLSTWGILSFQVSLYDNAPFQTISKCTNVQCVLISSST